MSSGLFNLFSIIISLVALIAYINYRYIKLPTTMAILLGSLALSCLTIIFGKLGYSSLEVNLYKKVQGFDFYKFLMGIALNFMLFARALNVNVEQFFKLKTEISSLAFISTLLSAALIGIGLYFISDIFHIPLSLSACLLFGALISPTDPIAVLALFRTIKTDRRISTLMSGESLINDGVGIVLFITCYQFAFYNLEPTISNISYLFIIEFLGGCVLGYLLGRIARHTFCQIDNIKVEFIISLAIVMGGFILAEKLGVSGPITMVAAGMVIKHSKKYNKEELYKIWEVIDDLFNAILFFLLGIELIVVSHNFSSLLLSSVAVVIVLISRYISILAPCYLIPKFRVFPKYTMKVLTWGGLRGGLAVALVLYLPETNDKSTLLTMTYTVVIFSMLVQGMTLKPLLKKYASS